MSGGANMGCLSQNNHGLENSDRHFASASDVLALAVVLARILAL